MAGEERGDGGVVGSEIGKANRSGWALWLGTVAGMAVMEDGCIVGLVSCYASETYVLPYQIYPSANRLSQPRAISPSLSNL